MVGCGQDVQLHFRYWSTAVVVYSPVRSLGRHLLTLATPRRAWLSLQKFGMKRYVPDGVSVVKPLWCYGRSLLLFLPDVN